MDNISKIMRKRLLFRLQPHILTYPNSNIYQSAYRRNHFTETALLCTLDYVYHSARLHKSTVLISLDLSEAFDTIDHFILLNFLQSTCGISGAALQWISSYLTSRSKYVEFGNSSLNHELSGIHQGFVIGPLLFTIFVCPIAPLLHHRGAYQYQYADDPQLFISTTQLSATADLHTLESALADLFSVVL
jgi:Reverse transcriptase (RNA-dependent DNA polymerase)